MDSIWLVLRWMFETLLTMKHPRNDHNENQFPSKIRRADLGGTPLRIGGMLLSKCGDWAWYKAVLGLRGWRGEVMLESDVGFVMQDSTTLYIHMNSL